MWKTVGIALCFNSENIDIFMAVLHGDVCLLHEATFETEQPGIVEPAILIKCFGVGEEGEMKIIFGCF